MRAESEEIKNKLYAIFERKISDMWKEDPPPVTPEGMYDTKHRAKFSQRWIDYIENLGGRVLEWTDALQGQRRRVVMFHNPGETPWELASMIGRPTYILIPDEVAMKTLALGELP
jgi:hypothetical protein